MNGSKTSDRADQLFGVARPRSSRFLLLPFVVPFVVSASTAVRWVTWCIHKQERCSCPLTSCNRGTGLGVGSERHRDPLVRHWHQRSIRILERRHSKICSKIIKIGNETPAWFTGSILNLFGSSAACWNSLYDSARARAFNARFIGN